MKRTNPGPAMRHIGRLLAERTDSGRLVRGHEIFEDELVDELRINGEVITAEIIGTRQWPYEVTMRLPRSADGELPSSARALRFECTCPDSGDPCKHGVALALAVSALIDLGHFPGVSNETSEIQRRRELEEHDARSAALSRRRPGVVVPVATTRPGWADNLGDLTPPATLTDWLGADAASDARHLDLGVPDALDLLIDLGPCEVPGGGPNLAGAIQLLVVRLLGGSDN